MKRPDHNDFWLLAQIVQDLDAAAEDVGLQRSLSIVDADSLVYVATQRGMRVPTGQPTEVVFPIAWIDGFAAGVNFQKFTASRDV